MGGGCRSGVDSKSGEGEGGFSNRASRSVLGKLGFGPKDTGQKDSGGKEIGSRNLLLAPTSGRTSCFGKFDRAAQGFGVREVEKKRVW